MTCVGTGLKVKSHHFDADGDILDGTQLHVMNLTPVLDRVLLLRSVTLHEATYCPGCKDMLLPLLKSFQLPGSPSNASMVSVGFVCRFVRLIAIPFRSKDSNHPIPCATPRGYGR